MAIKYKPGPQLSVRNFIKKQILVDLVEALEAHVEFWDKMPGGQLGKIVCDVGLLNTALVKSRKALAKASDWNK